MTGGILSRAFSAIVCMAILLGVFACQEQAFAPDPSTDRSIAARVAHAEAISPLLWERTFEIHIRFTSSEGLVLLDETVPFSTRRSSSVRAPRAQAVAIELEGLDASGLVMWVGSATVPSSETDQVVDVPTWIPLGSPAPDGHYLGRTEPVQITGQDSARQDLFYSSRYSPISLECATPSAEIHYTLDGTFPTTLSPLYTAPLRGVPAGTCIKAIAFAPRMLPSQPRILWIRDGSESFWPEVQKTVIGWTNDTFRLQLTAIPEGVVRYSTDGTPVTWASPLADTPIFIGKTTIVRSRLYRGTDPISGEFVDTFPLVHEIRQYWTSINRLDQGNPITEMARWAYPSLLGTRIHFRRDGGIPDRSDSTIPEVTGIAKSGWRLSEGTILRGWRDDQGWTPPLVVDSAAQPKEQSTRPLDWRLYSFPDGDTLELRAPVPFRRIKPEEIPDTVFYTFERGNIPPTLESPVLPSPFALSSLGVVQGGTVSLHIAAWRTGTRKLLSEQTLSYTNPRGTWTDSRNGRTYKTLVDSRGTLHMAEDLDYDTLDGVASWRLPDSISRAYAPKLFELDTNCLSPWSADCPAPPSPRGPCPEDWRLPTFQDMADAQRIPLFQSTLKPGWMRSGKPYATKASGGQFVYWSDNGRALLLGTAFQATLLSWDPVKGDAYRIRCVRDPR
jgi:hypothetical protein